MQLFLKRIEKLFLLNTVLSNRNTFWVRVDQGVIALKKIHNPQILIWDFKLDTFSFFNHSFGRYLDFFLLSRIHVDLQPAIDIPHDNVILLSLN